MIISEEFMRVRQVELLAEAEHNRLLALAKRKPVAAISTNARLLVWIGGAMRSLGSRLEDRFNAEVRSNQTQSADCGQKI